MNRRTPSRASAWLVRTAAFAIIALAGHLSAGEKLAHPLFQAIRRGDHALVESLLREGTPPGIRSLDGTTPLLLAALHAPPQTPALLLEHGADPNDTDGEFYAHPLNAALLAEEPEIAALRAWIDAGTDWPAGVELAPPGD